MNLKKIAVLTSEKSWFVPYAQKFMNILNEINYNANLFLNHEEISNDFEIVFILSYFKVIEKDFLKQHKHNIVIHDSDLPIGRGWAPLFWQILEKKNKIPITLFEASEKADEGDIYIKDHILLEGHELNEEIRKKQAEKTIEMCLNFLNSYNNLMPIKQSGTTSYYSKRTPKDSELDINKSIKEQFDLLRIVNNEEYPAFFDYNGCKYIVKIFKERSHKEDDNFKK